MTERRNLPDDIADKAREIQTKLAAEGPIRQAADTARGAAREVFEAATAQASAEFDVARQKFFAVQKPAVEIYAAAEDEAERARDRAIKDLRLELGHLLVAAQAKVGKRDWYAWCQRNVVRPNGSVPSRSDIYAMMRLVKSDDPVAARKAEQAKTKERVKKHRERESVTSPPVTDSAPAKPVEPPVEVWNAQARKMVEPHVVKRAEVNGPPAVATDVVVQNNTMFIKQVECLAARDMPSFEGGSGGDKIRAAWNAATLSARRRSLRALLNIEQPAAVKPDSRQIPMFSDMPQNEKP